MPFPILILWIFGAIAGAWSIQWIIAALASKYVPVYLFGLFAVSQATAIFIVKSLILVGLLTVIFAVAFGVWMLVRKIRSRNFRLGAA
jgi:hypothetical protein